MSAADPSAGADAASASAANETAHVIVGMNALLFVGLIVLTIFVNMLLDRYRFPYLPDSGAAMLLGMLIGLIMHLLGAYEEEEVVLFEPEVFFFILLPPIIFNAGFSMHKKNFFRNMSTILLFAIVGTIISTVVVGYGVLAGAKLGWYDMASDDPIECLIFGALISAIDPVATLSILGSARVNADPLLYSLVFGESVLNDAVSVVLFHTFVGIYGKPFTNASLWIALGEFFGVSLGSVVIGVIVALLCALIFKEVNVRAHPEYEFILVFFFAYASYCISEILGLSGIMALFFCGILMAHYTWYNMTTDARTTTKIAFTGIAHVCESFLFIYLGITAVIYLRASAHNLHWNFNMLLVTLVFAAISRGINIFGLSWLANLRRKKIIPKNMQIVMWFSGLRGAVAFALAMNVETPGRGFIVTTTMMVIILTTLFNGGATVPFLKKMGVCREPDEVDEDSEPETDDAVGSINGGMQLRRESGGMHRLWSGFDRRYLQPIFGGRYNDITSPPHLRPARSRRLREAGSEVLLHNEFLNPAQLGELSKDGDKDREEKGGTSPEIAGLGVSLSSPV